MANRLVGKVASVTGGASGIGQAMCRLLMQEGGPGPLRPLGRPGEQRRPRHVHPDVWLDRTPQTLLGRLAQPEDIAWGILYPASDESAYVTGSELVIDGG